MVGTLVRLQLKLLSRGFRQTTARTITTIIMVLYVGGLTAALAVSLAALRTHPSILGPVSVLGFGLLTLLWPVFGIFVSGGNGLADAGRFALFPLTARQLLPGLLVAGLFGIGSLATIVLVVALVYAWTTGVLTALLAVLGGALGLLMCVLATKCVTSAFSVALQRRRFKEFAAMLMMLSVLGLAYGFQALTIKLAGQLDVRERLVEFASVVAWTPFGWAWSLPWDAQAGRWLIILAKVTLCAVLIWLLARGWERFLARDLTSPLEIGGDAQRVTGHTIFDGILGAGASGAIARRGLRYWRRDSRRLMQVVIVLIMPLLMMIPLLLSPEGMPKVAYAYLPILCGLMAGSAIAWDISYDDSAVWMEIAAGISGRDDRWGRVLAFGAIFLPFFLVVLIALTILSGRPDLMPGVLGASACGLGAGLGIGSWVGAVWQTAMPPASGNMFRTSSGGGFETFIGSLITVFVPGLVTAPALVGAILAYWTPWIGWVTLVGGAGLGALILWLGVVRGGRRLDATWPEVLAKVTWKGN